MKHNQNELTNRSKPGDGLPWGTIAIVVLIIGGLGYFGYRALQTPDFISSLETKENERK